MILTSKSIKSYNNEAETKIITIFEDSKLEKTDLGLDNETLLKVKFIIEDEDFNGKKENLKQSIYVEITALKI